MTEEKYIDHLIKSEISYFQPILERQKLSTEKERALWRNETIRERQKRISLEVYEQCNGIVQYGPFKGMKINKDNWWGKLDLGSQCLGLYEKEILNFIEEISPYQYNYFIDIGAADGYYAIGMLLSQKCAHAICFEISSEGRETIQKNAEKNNVSDKIKILSEANKISLSTIGENYWKNSLVMIDIEGAEFDLFQADIFEKLKESTILIEIHNWVDNFEEKYINFLKNSSKYHSIQIIDRVERKTLHLEELRDFTDDNRLLLTSERRPCVMRFLKLTPLYTARSCK